MNEKKTYCIRVRLNGRELEYTTKYLANSNIMYFVKDEYSYLEVPSFLKVIAKMTEIEAEIFARDTGVTNMEPEVM